MSPARTPARGWHDLSVMSRREQLARWLPAVALGLAVLVLGLWELNGLLPFRRPDAGVELLFVVVFAVAVGAYRLRPSLALGLLWLVAVFHLGGGMPLLLVEAAAGVIAFGCARYGSVPTVVASAASVPAVGALVLVAWGAGVDLARANDLYFRILASGPASYSVVGAVILGSAVLIVPWLVGLLLRVLGREAQTRAEQIETAHERDQAAELAELREGQARLARDVHDVVGHSLAVILAQAESAQYLPDDEPARLKDTLATIATSARTSLQDVRQVLGATSDRTPRGGLDTLIDGVKASGHEVISTEIGDPRPLPPELEVVAYRVLQEMLTNAIRHGRRDEPVHVERHWQEELRIEVRNVIDMATVDTVAIVAAGDHVPVPGNGLEGMRRRLESVNGRLDVRPRTGVGNPTFTVTAWLPTGAR